MPPPRYLRFAQSLALCSSLAMLSACPSSTTAAGGDTPEGRDTSGSDTPIAEGDPADSEEAPNGGAGLEPALECSDCHCFDGEEAGRPACYDVGLQSCCVAVGPLSPPDLPA